jgi:hypothetical protein
MEAARLPGVHSDPRRLALVAMLIVAAADRLGRH